MRLGVPRRCHQLRQARADQRLQGRCCRGLDRLQALRSGPEAGVRLRHIRQRDHGHTDGPPTCADTSVQHDPAPRRRQGARSHCLRLVHRVTRQDERQPAVLEGLLHVLGQAEPAHHGVTAAGRRDHALHGHPCGRQALQRVLRAVQGHGRAIHQGAGLEDHREGQRGPHPALRGHRERRPDRRGRVRPRGPCRGHPAEQ